MEAASSRNTAALLARTSGIAAVFCLLSGVVVLIGWILRKPFLTRLVSRDTFVAPNTALLFILCATAVLLFGTRSRLGTLIARLFGAATAVFALLTVAEYAFHIDLGIDTLLLSDRVANWAVTPTPGRFALQTAIAFSCAGLALLLTDVDVASVALSEPFALVVLLISFFGLLGYVYSAASLHGVMALETAFILCALACALLLVRPAKGVMALVSSDGSAGIVARRLLVATAVVLPLLGWLQVQVGVNRWMERETRNALFAAASVLTVWLLVLSAARAIQTQEDRRRESEERFRSLSASSPAGIFLTDPQGRCLYANPRCLSICGFEEGQFSGEGWLKFVHPEDHDRVQRSWQAAVLQQNDWYDEFRWGTEMGAIHWTICRGAPMRSEAGELIGYAGTVEDVTERKLTELTLRKTEKLAAMGRLAGTIAHEINNPLEALTNLFYLVRNHSSLDREAREFADIAEQQLARIAAITRQSLSFYRDSATPTTVSLAEILGDVLDVHRDALQTHKIAAERRFETDGMIIAHPGELRQVFANLVGNAIQAMPAGGTLRVHLFAASQKGNSTRGGVRVNVVDTGTGIAPEIARKLFEPFFTTKAEKGTGLGLWVSRGIIEKYDGFVTFRSTRRPRTTCFSIFVPTVVEQVRRLRTKPVPKQLAGAQTS